MKTLYLSDLDGTLLGADARLSAYSVQVINQFVGGGGYFSYATARSFVTASRVTAGLDIALPAIVYNGGFVVDTGTKALLLANYFGDGEGDFIAQTLTAHGIYPIVYAYVDGVEYFSYMEQFVTPGMQYLLDSRIGDPRRRGVASLEALYQGDIFYITCIGAAESLDGINHIFDADPRYQTIYQNDIYSKSPWYEILPANATKANAALQLKDMLGCEKLVVFGDGVNDLSLFSVADEKYAMANAVPALKAVATAVIGANDDNGVAKWLVEKMKE